MKVNLVYAIIVFRLPSINDQNVVFLQFATRSAKTNAKANNEVICPKNSSLYTTVS